MPGTRWVISICCLIVPAAAAAQLQRADSLRILNEAHSAQGRFERGRRTSLPRVGYDDGHACETVVGRMCHWEDADLEPLPESRSILRARQSLIATLARFNAISPGDDWIAGERIRYMVQAGDDSAAVSVARSCSPPRWFCQVLRGFAFHGSERYGDAAAAFDSALAAMPADERCRWNDVSDLIDDDGQRARYNAIPCGQRDSVEAQFWDLAQPSFVVAANDRRTEHFARVLLADLAETATNTYGIPWGPDMRELLIRYGEPLWYSTTWPGPYTTFQTPVGHDRIPSFHFVATVSGDSVTWDAHATAARERYAPPYIDSLAPLNAQFAMMKRGDSALVVAAYADTSNGRAVLGISGATSDTSAAHPRERRIRRARAGWKGVMVAMEEFDSARLRDARAREWLVPPEHVPGAPELSTLLLFSGDTSAQVASLDDALGQALTSSELRGTRKLGLYWEVYGAEVRDSSARSDSTAPLDSGSTADSSSVLVTVARIDGGAMRWLGQALHITRRDSPLAVRWRDSGGGAGVESHSVVLDLAQLPGGVYRVSVSVGADEARRTEISREITLR